jgi:hypothetical protein
LETEEDMIEGEEPKEKKARFKILNPQELDDLAKKRNEPSTEKQTSWAIRILKGKPREK